MILRTDPFDRLLFACCAASRALAAIETTEDPGTCAALFRAYQRYHDLVTEMAGIIAQEPLP